MLLLHFFKEFYCPHAFSGSFIVLGFYLKEWWWRDTRGLTLTLPLKNALHRWGIQTLQEGGIQRRRGGGSYPSLHYDITYANVCKITSTQQVFHCFRYGGDNVFPLL